MHPDSRHTAPPAHLSEKRAIVIRVLSYWLPVGLYAAFIFYLSSQSVLPVTLPTLVEQLGDKLHHMLAYGLFGLLWFRAFRYCGGRWAASRAAMLAILACFLYGATDEVHQAFVPLRDSDPWDVVADTAGASVAVWAMDWWLTRRAVHARAVTQSSS